jgi:protein SCO1/2
MNKENKFIYGMVAISLLLVGGFIVLWKISSPPLQSGKSSTTTEFHVDRDIELIDSNGERRGFKQLEGKVSLVSHVFTRCPGQCAGIGVALKDLREEYKDEGPLQLVSVSLDPAHDTPELLKNFSETHGLSGSDWWFVTGDPEPLNKYMAEVFLLAAQAKPPEKRDNEFDLFDHQAMVVLVDHELKLRGWFYPFETESAKAMRAELKTALAEAKKAS